jgi:hypothetical protein
MKKEEFWQIMREYMIAKQELCDAIGEEGSRFFFSDFANFSSKWQTEIS